MSMQHTINHFTFNRDWCGIEFHLYLYVKISMIVQLCKYTKNVVKNPLKYMSITAKI